MERDETEELIKKFTFLELEQINADFELKHFETASGVKYSVLVFYSILK